MVKRRRLRQEVRDQPPQTLARCSPKVEDLDINRLRPTKSNPRVHSDRQISLIKRSIQRFGFNNPILIDSANNIIGGHGRVKQRNNSG